MGMEQERKKPWLPPGPADPKTKLKGVKFFEAVRIGGQLKLHVDGGRYDIQYSNCTGFPHIEVKDKQRSGGLVCVPIQNVVYFSPDDDGAEPKAKQGDSNRAGKAAEPNPAAPQ